MRRSTHINSLLVANLKHRPQFHFAYLIQVPQQRTIDLLCVSDPTPYIWWFPKIISMHFQCPAKSAKRKVRRWERWFKNPQRQRCEWRPSSSAVSSSPQIIHQRLGLKCPLSSGGKGVEAAGEKWSEWFFPLAHFSPLLPAGVLPVSHLFFCPHVGHTVSCYKFLPIYLPWVILVHYTMN